ncbi:helix-turn-helix domain-containing protein [Paenarthrobacter ilicis]|uniref:helix-turn-helix domain-containing protein n=1 Tax=Paenarthrobacter ilicis TaxID=43665 RepID=UPI00386F30DA
MSLITASDVAQIFDVSIRTVQSRAARGDMPFVFKGPGTTGAYLFDRAQIEALATQGGADDL